MHVEPRPRSPQIEAEVVRAIEGGCSNTLRPQPVLVVGDATNQPAEWTATLSAAGFQVTRVPAELAADFLRQEARNVLSIARLETYEQQRLKEALPDVSRWLLVADKNTSPPYELSHVLCYPFEPHVLVQSVRSLVDSSPVGVRSDFVEVPWPDVGGSSQNKQWQGELRGRLDFAELFGTLVRRRYTGVLLLRQDALKKMVYFRDGGPIFVRSNILGECLGQQMVASRMISETVCTLALEQNRRSGRRIGQVLMEMGEISELNLRVALQLQLVHKVVDLFTWRRGQYRTIRGQSRVESVPAGASTGVLMHEGLTRVADTASLIRVFQPLRNLYLRARHRDSGEVANSIDAEAWRAVAASPHTRVAELLAEPGIDRSRRVRLLAALTMVGECMLYSSPEPDREALSSDRSLGRGLVMPFTGREEPAATEVVRLAPVEAQNPSPVWPSLEDDELCRSPRGLAFYAAATVSPPPDADDRLVVPQLDAVLTGGEDQLDAEDQVLEWMPMVPDGCEDSVEPFPPSEIEHTADLDAEPLAFERLRERFAAVHEANFWDRLELTPGFYEAREIHQAYVHVRSRMEKDVASDGELSGRCQYLAEAALVALDDARAGLMHPDVLRRLSRLPDASMDWLSAVQAFDAGMTLVHAGREHEARTQFETALALDPSVHEYRWYAVACRPESKLPFYERLRSVSGGKIPDEGPPVRVVPLRERARTLVPRQWTGWFPGR